MGKAKNKERVETNPLEILRVKNHKVKTEIQAKIIINSVQTNQLLPMGMAG